MCDQQYRGKSKGKTKCNKEQHQGNSGYDICVEHWDVSYAHHKGAHSFGFIAWIPREAAVPIKVAISAESNANDQSRVKCIHNIRILEQ